MGHSVGWLVQVSVQCCLGRPIGAQGTAVRLGLVLVLLQRVVRCRLALQLARRRHLLLAGLVRCRQQLAVALQAQRGRRHLLLLAHQEARHEALRGHRRLAPLLLLLLVGQLLVIGQALSVHLGGRADEGLLLLLVLLVRLLQVGVHGAQLGVQRVQLAVGRADHLLLLLLLLGPSTIAAGAPLGLQSGRRVGLARRGLHQRHGNEERLGLVELAAGVVLLFELLLDVGQLGRVHLLLLLLLVELAATVLLVGRRLMRSNC